MQDGRRSPSSQERGEVTGTHHQARDVAGRTGDPTIRREYSSWRWARSTMMFHGGSIVAVGEREPGWGVLDHVLIINKYNVLLQKC